MLKSYVPLDMVQNLHKCLKILGSIPQSHINSITISVIFLKMAKHTDFPLGYFQIPVVGE